MLTRTRIKQIRQLMRKADSEHALTFALKANADELTTMALRGLYADELAATLDRISNLYVLRTTLSGTALRAASEARRLLMKYKLETKDV